MAKFLRLGEDPQGERWALPDETDLDVLLAQLTGGMEQGNAVAVTVRIDERRTGTLLVNGRAVPFVLLWEEGGPKPSFTLID